MRIIRPASPLASLCLAITLLLGITPTAQATTDLLSDLSGAGSTARGNDGVGGIERMVKPGAGPGGSGLIIPVTPTPPPPPSDSSTLTFAGWFDLGYGMPGTTTEPLMELVLVAQVQSVISLLLSGGLPGNDVFIVAGLGRQLTPFKGGTLVPNADILITGLTLDDRGELLMALTAFELLPSMTQVYLQAWMPDPTNLLGYSSTNAIALALP